MKYISKFNESNQDGRITDKDLEIIENCFLDYIVPGPKGEYSPDSCKLIDFRHIGFVSLEFEVPGPSDISIRQLIDHIRKNNNKIGTRPTIRQTNDIRKYLSFKWIYGLINRIIGDVRRLESYGFECNFRIFSDLKTLEVSIGKRYGWISMIDQKQKTHEQYQTPEILLKISEIMNNIKNEYGF